jgi:hypothetical protein
MNGTEPILSVVFFRTSTGREPVREWLKSMPDLELAKARLRLLV